MTLLKSAFLEHVNALSSPPATLKLARLRTGRATKTPKLEASSSVGTDVDSSGQVENYHIYRDSTGFDYDVTLTRVDLANNRNERYQLRVSNPSPYLTVISVHCSLPTIAVRVPF